MAGSYNIKARNTVTSCEVAYASNPVVLTTPLCIEICGDGFNYGQFKCDDGNTLSGDGCSSKCTVEAGFACSGGSALTSDVCYDI